MVLDMIWRRIRDAIVIPGAIFSVGSELRRIGRSSGFAQLKRFRESHPAAYVLIGNDAFAPILENCLASLDRSGAAPVILFATRALAARVSGNANVLLLDLEELLEVGDSSVSYGTAAFKKLMRGKVLAVVACLMAGIDVVYTDGDIVWKTPFDWKSYGDCDVAFQLENREFIDQVEWSRHLHKLELNAGLFAIRANWRSRCLLRSIIILRRIRPHFSDQPAVNCVFQYLVSFGLIRSGSRRFSGIRLSFQPLPMKSFPNGYYFRNNMEALNEFPDSLCAIHFNHIVEMEKKISFMRETGCWV